MQLFTRTRAASSFDQATNAVQEMAVGDILYLEMTYDEYKLFTMYVPVIAPNSGGKAWRIVRFVAAGNFRPLDDVSVRLERTA